MPNQSSIQPSIHDFLLLIGTVVLVLLLTLFGLQYTNLRLQKIAFYGDFENIDIHHLEKLSTQWSQLPFYFFKEHQIIQDLQSVNWLDQAEISFNTLGELSIFITESRPVFRWRQQFVVQSDGQYFRTGARTNLKYQHLPEIIANAKQLWLIPKITASLETLNQDNLGALLSIEIKPWGELTFQYLRMSLTVDSADIEQQIKRAQLYLSHSDQSLNSFKQLDLRYNKSIAVKSF